MAKIFLTDVTIHVDETLDKGERSKLENDLRATDGVVSVHFSEKTPHLIVVTYDPDQAKSKDVLKVALGEQLHAELIGI